MTMLSMMKLLKKKKYNSQVDIGRDSHNYDYDAVLDNLRAEEKSISLITDFTINNPDIQDYCKHLILYNLTVHDYKDISFGEWIVNLKGLSGLAYIPVSFTKNGISDKTNYSCECKKILITELIYVNVTYQICRILLRNHSLLKRIF